MKKTLAIVLSALMIIMLFAGCGEEPADDVTESAAPATESTAPAEMSGRVCYGLHTSGSSGQSRAYPVWLAAPAAARFSLSPTPWHRYLTRNIPTM